MCSESRNLERLATTSSNERTLNLTRLAAAAVRVLESLPDRALVVPALNWGTSAGQLLTGILRLPTGSISALLRHICRSGYTQMAPLSRSPPQQAILVTVCIMLALTTRAAMPADVGGFDGLLPDRWREGNNRRSVVATDQAGRVLGHCRGIDNDYHPGSRMASIAVAADEHRGPTSWPAVANALIEAQLKVSTRPLHLKVKAHDRELIDLCRRHDGVLIQLMPPWRYVVDVRMHAWAQAHRATADGLMASEAGALRAEEMLELYVEHYTAQHANWSPAADAASLRALNAPDFVPGATGAFDPARSTVLIRSGRIAAQALAWPADDEGRVEISLHSTPYQGPTARGDMEACLAAVIGRSADSDVLLVDSHVSESLETAMMRAMPSPPPHPADSWTAIVALPIPGEPTPTPLRPGRMPAAAAPFTPMIRV